MCKAIISFVFICLLLDPTNAQSKVHASTAPSNPFGEADHLFTFGEDARRDKQALAAIERALANDSTNYQWLWRAARTSYYVGEDAPKSEKLGYFERGMEVGTLAVAREPNAVEGHFWLAVNYGGYSEQKGVFKALVTVKKIRAEMEIVLRLDDKYQDGGAYLALGEMDRQLPRIIGGNLSRAITRLEQGVRIAPYNLEMKLSLADAYRESGRKEDARRQLLEVTERQVKTNAERRLQEKARQMLARL